MARFLPLLSFLLVALAVQASDAASSAEAYWRSVLPNTAMPAVVRDLIYPDKAVPVSASEGTVGYTTFLEKSLQPGSTMEIDFSRVTTGASLLPRQVADSIPFSSSKLPEILSRLSVDPSSQKAASIKKTLAKCEANAFAGQTKTCATSLESMIDFAVSSLKSSNLRALSTSSAKAATSNRIYTIAGFNKVKASELVGCHAQRYAYVVYHCHSTTASAYTVSLVGSDGTKVQALVGCHMYGAAYDAEVYKKLNVKPGSAVICHFLHGDDLLWARV